MENVLCSSRDGVPLGPERTLADKTVYQSLLIYTTLHDPLFSLDSTFKRRVEAEFLEEIQTKIFGVFLLAVHRHLYSFDLKFLFLQTYAASYKFYSSVTVHCKGGKT
jgi:hypothetical protein